MMAMPYRQALAVICSQWGHELIVTSAGNSSELWYAVTRDTEKTFYLEASMSMASMFAAGLAQGIPEANVWAFSGDGAFCMNPGMLMVERELNLPNLKHIIMSNRAYGSTSNVPLPGHADNDYVAIARGFGIENVWSFDSIGDLESGFDDASSTNGYGVIVLELEPVTEKVSSPPMDGPEVKFRFGRYVERAFGRKLFDAAL
jgi:sulfopyruvate decarboxylase subunit beta